MMVLLAAGLGLGAMGLLAIAIGIPISDSSFGNALLIAGVMIFCTGCGLVGLWVAVRDLKQALAGAPPREAGARSAAPKSKVAVSPIFPQPADRSDAAEATDSPDPVRRPAAPVEPPWANEAASRANPRPPQTAPEIAPPVEPVVDAPPPAPERTARRNLLFSTKRRDKAEADAAPPPRTALESEPAVSFDNAWPQSPRADMPPAPQAQTAPEVRPPTAEPAPAPAEVSAPLPEGVSVVKSGVVDGMSYTLFSDGSIEARLAGEGPIRFASLDALRTYLDQRQ